MLVRYLVSVAFCLCLVGNSLASHDDHVSEIAHRALVLARRTDEVHRARCLSDVALLFARNGEEEYAHDIFNEALRNLPSTYKGSAFDVIASCQAAAGLFDDALSTIEKKRTDGNAENDVNSCFYSVAIGLANRGEFSRAKALVDERMNDDLWRSITLAQMSAIAYKEKDLDLAQSMVDEAMVAQNAVSQEVAMKLGDVDWSEGPFDIVGDVGVLGFEDEFET